MIKMKKILLSLDNKINLSKYNQFNINDVDRELSLILKSILKYFKVIRLKLLRVFVIYYMILGITINVIISNTLISSIQIKLASYTINIDGKGFKFNMLLIKNCTFVPLNGETIKLYKVTTKNCSIYNALIKNCRLHNTSLFLSNVYTSKLKYIKLYQSNIYNSTIKMLLHSLGVKLILKYNIIKNTSIDSLLVLYNTQYTIWYTVLDNCLYKIATLGLNVKQLIIRLLDYFTINNNKLSNLWKLYNSLFNTTISNLNMGKLKTALLKNSKGSEK